MVDSLDWISLESELNFLLLNRVKFESFSHAASSVEEYEIRGSVGRL